MVAACSFGRHPLCLRRFDPATVPMATSQDSFEQAGRDAHVGGGSDRRSTDDEDRMLQLARLDAAWNFLVVCSEKHRSTGNGIL